MDDVSLIPVEVNGVTVYLSVTHGEERPGDEHQPEEDWPVGANHGRVRSIDEALVGVAKTAQAAMEQMSALEWTSLALNFGVKFTVKSGKIFAVIGGVEATSSLNVEMTFQRGYEKSPEA